jgi:hypothetical protein
MGGACSTFGVEERYVHSFGGGNLRGRDHIENLDVHWGIILKLIFKIQNGAWNRFVWHKIGNNGGLL